MFPVITWSCCYTFGLTLEAIQVSLPSPSSGFQDLTLGLRLVDNALFGGKKWFVTKRKPRDSGFQLQMRMQQSTWTNYNIRYKFKATDHSRLHIDPTGISLDSINIMALGTSQLHILEYVKRQRQFIIMDRFWAASLKEHMIDKLQRAWGQ